MKLDYKSVQENPEKVLAWFEGAIILPGLIKNSTSYGRPETLALLTPEEAKQNVGHPKTGERKRRVGGYRSCPVYYICNARGGPALNGYICDYDQGELNYQVLGQEADLCFTTTMNGCTFGVGSPTQSGEVIVTHTNANYRKGQVAAGNNPTGSQPERQLSTAQQFYTSMGMQASYLEPAQYRTESSHNITTFGLRGKGGWKFYFQKYSYLGNGKYRLLGVFPITTNQTHG